MTATVEPVARAPIAITAPAGISQVAWYPTASSSLGSDAGTVFLIVGPDRESYRREQVRNSFRDSLLSQFKSLLRLEPGWDSYGALTISPRTMDTALAILASLGSAHPPCVVPTVHGGVQLEWHDSDIDVEIECLPSGHVLLFGQDRRTQMNEERWVVPGHPAIDAWLQRLRIQA